MLEVKRYCLDIMRFSHTMYFVRNNQIPFAAPKRYVKSQKACMIIYYVISVWKLAVDIAKTNTQARYILMEG